MNIQKLKSLNLDRLIELDEAIELSADARTFERECEELELPLPEWLVKSTAILREEIARRTHASTLAELQRVENELSGYMSVGEKKNAALKRLAELQAKLGMSGASKAAKTGSR